MRAQRSNALRMMNLLGKKPVSPVVLSPAGIPALPPMKNKRKSQRDGHVLDFRGIHPGKGSETHKKETGGQHELKKDSCQSLMTPLLRNFANYSFIVEKESNSFRVLKSLGGIYVDEKGCLRK
jgi:hypothetical protein